MRLKSHSRRVGLGLASGVCVAALVSCAGGGHVSAEAAGLDTIDPGLIQVAVQPYAPYTSLKADKLSGLDSDILNAAAENLGLEVQPQLTDFNGMLGGVQSRRVDVAIGGVRGPGARP